MLLGLPGCESQRNKITMAKNNSNAKRQRNHREVGLHYKKKFRWLKTCVYCGQPKESLDHVFPLSMASGLDFSNRYVARELRRALYLVPCCNSCNSIAANKPFASILDKRHHIQSAIRKKHLKKLRVVLWERDEIEELGHAMQSEVVKMIKNRYILESRVNYPRLQSTVSKEVVEMFNVFADVCDEC